MAKLYPPLLIVTQAIDQEDQVLGFFHRWVEEFAKHCESITVVCLREGKHSLPPNVRVFSLGKEKSKALSIVYAFRFLYRIWKERKAYENVFVHMNTEYVLLGGLLFKILRKQIVLWYAHGSVTLRLRLAIALSHRVVTSSYLGLRVGTYKRVVVGQGIDTDQFAPMPKVASKYLRLVTTGRISKRKQVSDILPALDALYGRGIKFIYSIVGAPATREDISYTEDLKSQIAQRPYAAQVHFAGAIMHDNLPSVLQETDVFINLSQTGSMDKAVLEAISCAIPTISSNSAYKDLLSPYGMYAKNNDGTELADMIERAIDVPVEQLRNTVIEQHSLSKLIPKILAVL